MSAPIISLAGVHKHFGRVHALRGVDLEVHPGRLFGLVGPNGAGKTTLFSVLCGFLSADSGTVQVAGRTIDTAHAPQRGVVGLLPQDASFHGRVPVGRQLRLYAELSGMSAEQATQATQDVLTRVGLPDAGPRLPRTLSHGMLKRVAIAQAVLGDPRLIILDEPTAGLDPHAARDIKALLRSLREGRTLVISSHNLSEIEDLCDEVAILHDGQVVRHDSVAHVVGQAAEMSLRLAAAPTPAQLDAMRRPAFVTDVSWDPGEERLRVAFAPEQRSAHEACRDLVVLMVDEKIPFVEIQLGKSLETRFIEETRR